MDALIVISTVVALLTAHEAAHAFVARAVGAKVLRLSVGIGPRLAQVTVRGMPVDLRLVPGFGWCEIAGDRPLGPGRRLAIVLAGPAANLALGAGLLLAGWRLAGAGALDALARSAWGLLLAPWVLVSSRPLAELLPWAGGGSAQALVLIGLASAAAGWLNLVPLAPLDGWRALLELLNVLGLRLQPTAAHQMARVSSAVLIGVVGVMVMDMIPRGGEAFIALVVMASAVWLIRLVYSLEQRDKGGAP